MAWSRISKRRLILTACTALAAANVAAKPDDHASEATGAPYAPDFEGRAPEPTLQGGTAAVPIQQVVPEYPEEARRRGQEGFVTLNFVVEPDGSAADPIVEDSSGIKELEKAAIASILRTRYKPATWNGKPIQQCATRQIYHFIISGRELGARLEFVSNYKQVVKLNEQQRSAEADAKLDEMVKKGAWNNYESARLWLMRASFQERRGDELGALRSYRRATLGRGMHLEPKIYRSVLTEVFRLEVKMLEFADALETYSVMTLLKPPMTNEAVARVVGEIRDAISGSKILAFPGTVEFRTGCEEGASNWQHTLVRRKFAFSDTQGRIDEFQLRCDLKRVRDKVSIEKTWEVPRSWGHCEVFVFGDRGAKVTLLEYPADTHAATKPPAGGHEASP